MTVVSAKAAREKFSELIGRIAYGKERVVLTRNGRQMAAMIPIEEYRLLEQILEQVEDEQDVAEAHAALEEVEREGTIPWEDVKKELNL